MSALTMRDLELSGNINLVKELSSITILVHGRNRNGLEFFFDRCLPILAGTSSIHRRESRNPDCWDGYGSFRLSGFGSTGTVYHSYTICNTTEKVTRSYPGWRATAPELRAGKGRCLQLATYAELTKAQLSRVFQALDLIFPLVRPGLDRAVSDETLSRYDEDGDFSVAESAVCACCGAELVVTEGDYKKGCRIQYSYTDRWPVCGDSCEAQLDAGADQPCFTINDGAERLLSLLKPEDAAQLAAAPVGAWFKFHSRGVDVWAFSLSSELLLFMGGKTRQIYLPDGYRGFRGTPSAHRRLYRRAISRKCATVAERGRVALWEVAR